MKSYITNRKQRVKIQNIVSENKTVSTGVPQGTILGPLLFILYVNDMLKDNVISYADDTAIITTANSWTEVEAKMNEDLECISSWLALNRLSLNISKTVFITFGNYNNSIPNNLDIRINQEKINRVSNCKYLGLIFDCNMKWEEHIKYIVSKTKYLTFVFYKLSKLMNLATLRLIYYALFNSVISYGILAWGGAYSNALQLLKNLQKKLLKIINKNNFVIQGNPLHIQQMYELESLSFHYENLKSMHSSSKSNTRKKLIQIPIRWKTVSSKNSYIKAIELFNNLPNNLKNLTTKCKKKKLKEWIRSNN